jgi:2-polyprenyl-3-methyl-5-hydroxy-6-metoxy-1,4-benzoquinol methylase
MRDDKWKTGIEKLKQEIKRLKEEETKISKNLEKKNENKKEDEKEKQEEKVIEEELKEKEEKNAKKISEDKDTKILRLKKLLKTIIDYQPIYGLESIIKNPKRKCWDRCEAVYEAIGNVSGKKILDIGSSLGFVSFYFADRGAVVEGWEANYTNAEVSRLISELNNISVTFKTQEFNLNSINFIKKGDFDIVFIFSVLHHVTYYQGLNTTKELMKRLIDTVPVLIVELARKGDRSKHARTNKSQPENELEIFDLIKDYVTIKKLGEFEAFKKPRPIYIISKNTVI